VAPLEPETEMVQLIGLPILASVEHDRED